MARKPASSSKPRAKSASAKKSKSKATATAKRAAKAADAAATDSQASIVDDNASMSSAAVATIILPDCLDGQAAVSIKDLLLAERGRGLVLDAGRVRRTGAQSLQVLIAAAMTWRADGQSFATVNASTDFIDTLALAGLSRDVLHLEGSCL